MLIERKKSPVVSLIFLFQLIFFSNNSLAQTEISKIKIGVSTPLSGDVSPAGYDVRDALIFANSHFFNNKYELIFTDDHCDGQTAVTSARKLISVEKVKYVLGMVCNNALLPVAPIYEKSGTIVITAGATSGDIKNIGSKIFQLYPADPLSIPPLYEYVSKNHKKLGILTQLDAFTDSLERAFQKTNKSSKEPIEILSEQAEPTSSDFRSQLTRLKSKNVEAIFINALAESGYIAMINQAKELGIKAKLYAVSLPASPTTRDIINSADEGVVFSHLPLTLTTEGKEIFSKFRSEYGTPRSVEILQPLAIDSLRMLDEALTSGESVESYLKKINFQGLIGNLSFNSDGAVQGIPYKLQRIENGKVVKVKDL